MKILVTGKSGSGAWAIRGEQLGAALGATVRPDAPEQLMREHDVVILVKRPPSGFADRARHAGAFVVWDVVDAWPQPDANAWPYAHAVEWLRREAMRVGARVVVCSNDLMADAAGENALVVPHHAWDRGERNRPLVVANEVRRVGYQGRELYISGEIGALVRAECASRGWEFVSAPDLDLTSVDIAVAFRDAPWSGDIASSWKSNVKLANMQHAGVPGVLAAEESYVRFCSGAERWIRQGLERESLRAAFDSLVTRDARENAAKLMRTQAHRFSLSQIAADYRAQLEVLRA